MKVVCFDFDGTLANSFKFVLHSFDCIFYKYQGIHMSNALFDKLSGPDELGFIKNQLGDKFKEEYWEEYLNYYRANANKEIKVFSGMVEMLQNLKNRGYHLVFLSGRSKDTSIISLNDLGIFDLFEKHYYGSPLGCVKDIRLQEVINDFKIESKDLLYIGDSFQDILDVKKVKASIISVLFDNPRWWDKIKKENPNFAYNVEELEEKIIEFMEK